MMRMFAGLAVALLFSSTAFADTSYSLAITPPSTAAKGTAVTVKVHVEGAGGWALNTEYPLSLSITAPSGVTVEKAVQSKTDAVKFDTTGADFNVRFTAATAGTKGFTGQLKFAVVQASNVVPKAAPFAFSVTVQ